MSLTKGTFYVTITAKVRSKKYKCKIKVEAPSISKKTYTMKKGEKYTLKIKGTTQKIKWSSSDKKVATVNSKGKVTAKNNGKVTITAKVGKSKYKCKITVGNVVKISETEHAINAGENFTLKITGTSEKITWSSSDTSIATVDKNGKEAITHFKVLKRYNEKYTLLEINIETGRTHQIRVHLSHIGYPIIGDDTYSNGKNEWGVIGQCLHAKSLKFEHPITGKEMLIEADLPEYFQKILENLEGK